MKLYIDMIAFYLQKAGGVTNVWKELLMRMLRDNKDIVLILQSCECCNIYFSQIMSLNPKVIYDVNCNIKANRYLPVRCSLENDSGFVSTYYRVPQKKNLKQYTLVHDFIYEYYVKGIKKWVHSWQKRKSVRNAETVICVSQNTMNDLITFYPWAKDKKCLFIYNGVGESYRKIDGEIYVEELGNYNYQNFLLYVGSRAKYKRFDYAVDVAGHFGYSLVIVGGGKLTDNETKKLDSKLYDNYIHINDISDSVLNMIYNKAFALIYPSEYEGFGIPIIEAQRAGCPVIAMEGSSISEVFGNRRYLVKDSTMEEAERILSILRNIEERKDFCNQGYINSKRFDWEKMYAEFKKIME